MAPEFGRPLSVTLEARQIVELPTRVSAFWEHREPNTPQWRLESAEQREEHANSARRHSNAIRARL